MSHRAGPLYSLLIFVREVCEIGDNSRRATPVPIPNTAVKPTWADGTNAQLGVGRVGVAGLINPLNILQRW